MKGSPSPKKTPAKAKGKHGASSSPKKVVASSSSSNRNPSCTVGLVIKGLVVDSIVHGGAADFQGAGRICTGDYIVAVDDVPVDSESVIRAIIGSDVVGSRVKLTLHGENGKKTVELSRVLKAPPAMASQQFPVREAMRQISPAKDKENSLIQDDAFSTGKETTEVLRMSLEALHLRERQLSTDLLEVWPCFSVYFSRIFTPIFKRPR